jgi:hypothetical protein
MNDDFKFVIPAEIQKGADGEWRVAGIASTSTTDRQGEIIVPGGIDATPIAKGKGFFNWDHDNSPENTVGVLDSYKKSANGMYVEGRLFKNHTRAKAVYEIMSSLNKGDKGRVGMSVEGKVLERDSANPSIIKRCLIKNVALTMNPVNQDTFADIVKSMTGTGHVEFDSTGKKDGQIVKSEEPTFTPSQVLSIVEKALGIGAGNAQAPAQMKGGDALGQEEMDKKKKKADEPKKLKKSSKELFKSQMLELLDKLQALYPNNSRTEIWTAVQDRMETKFPELKTKKL